MGIWPTLLVSIVSSAVTTLITNYLAVKRQDRQNDISYKQLASQNKINLTLNLYKEFNSTEISSLLFEVNSIVEKCFQHEPYISYEQLKEFDSDDFKKLHNVVHFLERIAILYHNEYLDKTLFQLTMSNTINGYYHRLISRFIDLRAVRNEPERRWMKPLINLVAKTNISY